MTKKEKRPKSRITRIINIIKSKPKKTMFKRERATIIIPKEELKPILKRRSKYFTNEYEKEKNLLGWK